MKPITFKNILMLLSVILSLAAASCSNEADDYPDNPGSSEPAQVRMALRAPGNRAEVQGTLQDPANEYEKIKDWWMVFVDSNGKVAYIVERPSGREAVEEETVEIVVTSGTYTIYAFANITKQDLKEATGLEFVLHDVAPSNIGETNWDDFPNDFSRNKDIPMTGFKTVTIEPKETKNFAIEVVRMVAKVTFKFTTTSEQPTRVLSAALSPLSKGKLPLMPDYTSLGGKPVATPWTDTEKVPFDFAGDNILIKNGDDAVSQYAYVRESLAESYHPTGHFALEVVTSTGTFDVKTARFAIAEELSYINRNDHIVLPVKLTEYNVILKALFYPPIGGYPAMVIDQSDEECYITFGTRGKFTITPEVSDAENGSIVDKNLVSYRLEAVSDPDGILSKTPTLDVASGDLLGEVNKEQGTAMVTVEVTVKVSESVNRIYNKKIYIIRKN